MKQTKMGKLKKNQAVSNIYKCETRKTKRLEHQERQGSKRLPPKGVFWNHEEIFDGLLKMLTAFHFPFVGLKLLKWVNYGRQRYGRHEIQRSSYEVMFLHH